jgi:autotransporter-associated beta strand protein
MVSRANSTRSRCFSILFGTASAVLVSAATPAFAQITRVTGIDVSAWQGNLSQTNWNTIHNVDGKAFAFIRSSRGGTTGFYNQSDPNNNLGDNELSMRYDDPYFVQNITYATNTGMFAGPYHFGRMDVTEETEEAIEPNNGIDEANHFLEMAGAWMRPGFLLPVFDFEAGINDRTPSELAQFAIDFSDTIYEAKGIRPAVYIGNNYASPMDNIPESAGVVAAYPTLWTARWPNQANPGSIDIQNTDPGDYTSSVYGPWDNPPNTADPWHFWQYASTGRLQGIANGTANVDLDVAHGGMEYLKDHLVPALWTSSSSGNWTALANWNSGEAPVAPTPGEGQVPPTMNTLPAVRLPGANDTVVLERAENITITLDSGGPQNIRKLIVREKFDIAGTGVLNIGYVPSADSTTYAAKFSETVTLSGNASLNVHTIQVDPTRTFNLAGGSITFNTISLGPQISNAAVLAITGDVNFSPLSNATATVFSTGGSISQGRVDLSGGARSFNVANGTSDIDLAINVPVINGGIIKIGDGTLALNNTNTYTGDTVVNAGRLRLSKASLADASSIYLGAGTTLDLNFTGNPDYVRNLYINGVPQAYGIWGAPGSGAQFTSPYLTGSGKLNVTPNSPPPPPPWQVLDDFEVDEGHFNWAFNTSPQTANLGAGTTIDRVTTEHQGFGNGSQLLNLVPAAAGAWTLRHNSGIGANMAAQPAGNVPLDSTGYVGFWLKTDDAGLTVRIGIDDPVGGNTALERGFAQPLIADNEWHLYQWNLENANHWDAFSGGADGDIDGAGGHVTIDSIWLFGSGAAQIFLDNVSHNPLGLLAASVVPGDYNGDGVVSMGDFQVWRSSLGSAVTPGAKADGDSNGIVDIGDYVTWRKLFAIAGGTSSAPAAIPEPTGAILLAIIVTVLLSTIRRPGCSITS